MILLHANKHKVLNRALNSGHNCHKLMKGPDNERLGESFAELLQEKF